MRRNMPAVIELELWSQPSSNLPRDIGKELIGPRCTNDLDLPAGVVLGLSEVPDEIDAENLVASIAAGELSQKEFDEFCDHHCLEANVRSKDSAAKFLEFAYGRPLAWVHLPDSLFGIEMGDRINAWARSNGYCLVEPDSAFCILEGARLEHLWSQDA